MSIIRNIMRKIPALLVVPALLLALSACTASPGASNPPSSSPGAVTMSASDWRVAFAGCMRNEGIDMPDPGTGSGGLNIDSSNQDAMVAAAKKCHDKLGPIPPLSQAEKDSQNAELQKAKLAAAKCLRDNGVDVADPKPGESLKVPDSTPQDIQDKCGAGARGATEPIGG